VGLSSAWKYGADRKCPAPNSLPIARVSISPVVSEAIGIESTLKPSCLNCLWNAMSEAPTTVEKMKLGLASRILLSTGPNSDDPSGMYSSPSSSPPACCSQILAFLLDSFGQ